MKRIFALLLSTVCVLSLASCGAQDVSASAKETTEASVTSTSTSVIKVEISTNSANNSKTDNSSAEVDETDELIDIYYNLIEEVSRIVYLDAEPMWDELIPMQGSIRFADEEAKDSVGFCFVDLDEDGKKEILIGDKYTLYAIGSYSGTGPYVMAGAGYRSMLSIYENGLIVCEGSSGAACYSYDFMSYDGVELVTDDFFYTDYDDEAEDDDYLAFYHNKTGEWTCDPSERITRDEFNVMTDIGVERLDYTGQFIPVSNYRDRFCIIDNDVTLERLAAKDVTWSLCAYETKDSYFPVTDDDVIQIITFFEDESVLFYIGDSESGEWAEQVVFEPKADNYADYAALDITMKSLGYMYVYLYGFYDDGTLVTQRYWYDEKAEESKCVYEYYMASLG